MIKNRLDALLVSLLGLVVVLAGISPVGAQQIAEVEQSVVESSEQSDEQSGEQGSDLASQIFDRDRLLEVKIEIDEDEWNQLRKQSRNFVTALSKPRPPSPYSYFKANVSINGKKIENVGLRKKGFIGSQDTERPSLKIKFDEFEEQEPLGELGVLTLNNNKQDRSLVSQFLAYKLFADAKLPASRCSLAKVWVNDELLGIYSHVESVKKPMLARNFEGPKGKLYEGTLADFIGLDVDGFEAKQEDEADVRSELSNVAKLIAEPDDVDLDALDKHLNVDEFLRFWALESLINFWDGYTNNQNNFFVYFHPDDGRLHFMPWGVDAAFGTEGVPWGMKPGCESVHAKSYLANRLYHTSGLPERYRTAMHGLLETTWKEKLILAEIDRAEKLVDGHTHESQQDFRKAMRRTRGFVSSRRRHIERDLENWPQKIAPKPGKPVYMAKVGTGVGKFRTTWVDGQPEEPYDIGEAELELTIDGEKAVFTKLGVHAMQTKDRRAGWSETSCDRLHWQA